MTARRLIVNADDFGRSAAINEGVLRGHVEGIVTSASLMVRYPDADDAARAARAHPGLGVGLHLDLGGWEQFGGTWRTAYLVVDADDGEAVAAEIARQLERFRTLVGSDPTHLDSHHHVHRDEPVRAAAGAVAGELGIPLREAGPVRYCGDFYGQDRHGASLPDAISATAFTALIRDLPVGITELACHPASRGEDFTSYSTERVTELRSLCDPAVGLAVHESGIGLCNFAQIARATSGCVSSD